MKWNFDDRPEAAGWYAIAYCWDPDEGTFFGKDYWDGKTWAYMYPVVAICGPFETEDAAADWADKNAYE